MRSIRTVFGVLGALIALVVVAAPVAVEAQQAPGRIVYVSNASGRSEIWVMNDSGDGQTQLTDDPGREFGPRFSPGGTRIAYERSNADGASPRIWVMNADGTDQHEISPAATPSEPSPPGPPTVDRDRRPAWSPDGTKIAFIREGIFTPQGILVMDADGTNVHVIHPLPQPERAGSLSWSPDGSKIAFDYNTVIAESHINIINADGSPGDNPLLTGGVLPGSTTFEIMPAWSPDGSKIAFYGKLTEGGLTGIWTVNVDGSNPVLLIQAEAAWPSWSPNGEEIAFNNATNVMLMKSDGTAITPLATGGQPHWAPHAVADASNPSGEFTALTPTRVLDTRDGTGGQLGALGNDAQFDVQLTGVSGVPVSGVSAVVLNATVTGTTAQSYLTIWPSGVARPVISNLNYVADQTVPNLVTVAVGAAGKLSVYNNSGATHVIFDVVGFYSDASGPLGSRFHGVSPFRYFDTRDGTGGVGAAPLGAGGVLKFTVTGKGGVPVGATGVAMNVTVTAATDASFLTVYPDDVARPLASNLNFVSGSTVPNLVVMRVPANGIVDFYNKLGSVHLLADVVGHYDSDKSSEAGRFVASTPVRVFDSRVSSPYPPPGSMQPNSILALTTSNPANGAAVFNVTVTQPTSFGWITVFPDPPPPPLASSLNFVPGQTVPNLVMVGVGPLTRKVDFYNRFGNTHLVVDFFGYFTNATATGFGAQTTDADHFTHEIVVP